MRDRSVKRKASSLRVGGRLSDSRSSASCSPPPHHPPTIIRQRHRHHPKQQQQQQQRGLWWRLTSVLACHMGAAWGRPASTPENHSCSSTRPQERAPPPSAPARQPWTASAAAAASFLSLHPEHLTSWLRPPSLLSVESPAGALWRPSLPWPSPPCWRARRSTRAGPPPP